ncbi:MAG: circadian clock protein KaiC [Verrucomicrobia bacterium]|nr:circadian clock protein KaiC [Deltaproteobacteria bacterium]
MTMPPKKKTKILEKCPTGIRGLDDITRGGLPRGRPTLVCGGTGCGKTLLALEFIVRGIQEFDEPGVFMSFEETSEELAKNVASLGFDLEGLIRSKKLAMDYVHVERSEIEETGEYDLEGLFIRLNAMIEETGAKRVGIDSLEALFAGLPNEAILRSELRRLFRWLKDKGVTTVITGEQGNNELTRHGLEEYVSDCVIFLNHRVVNRIGTRLLRIVKYRGSSHGTNEYPTMIDEHGLSVLPISSLGFDYPVTTKRVSTGIDRLDAMLGGKGYYSGSSVLISGTAGTGKSSLAAAFADAACRRGERCLYVAFEEAPAQITRNMASINFDLKQWTKKGSLRFHAIRSTLCGLEQHLGSMIKLISEFHPTVVVIDPVTNLSAIGSTEEIKAMLTQVIDFCKNKGITALFTSLTEMEQTEMGVSSLMDTWVLLRNVETPSGERNRLLFVHKSRGMAHSSQVREFVLSDKGIQLTDVYVGGGTVLTGSARLIQEAQDKAKAEAQLQDAARRQRELEQEKALVQVQIEALQHKAAVLAEDIDSISHYEQSCLEAATRNRAELASARQVD